MAQCSIAGLWDQVLTAPYLSRQQWQAYNLWILCQLVVAMGGNPNMSTCTVDGLWDQIHGAAPFLSDQQFYAENINLLCQLLLLSGGGGGGLGSVRHGSGPPVGLNPGTLTTQYTDDNTGIQYTYTSGIWI